MCEPVRVDCCVTDETETRDGFRQVNCLGDSELCEEPGGGPLVFISVVHERPCTSILVTQFVTFLPVRTVRARRHTPDRVAIGTGHSGGVDCCTGEHGVPEHLLGSVSFTNNGCRLVEVQVLGTGRCELKPVEVLLHGVDGGRSVDVTTAGHRGSHRAAVFNADTPLVNGNTVRSALSGYWVENGVTVSSHGQPGVSEAPSEREVLRTVVHVSIDFLAVDGAVAVHLGGEEHRDVFIGSPVDGNTEVVTVDVLELLLDVRVAEPVVAEPVLVRELLGRQLVDNAVRTGSEAQSDEVIEVKGREGGGVSQQVGNRVDVITTLVATDRVGVIDVTVIHGGPCLNFG